MYRGNILNDIILPNKPSGQKWDGSCDITNY